LKKRSKKLLLPRLHHQTADCVGLRGAKQVKVFWFFFSKKNTFLPALASPPHIV
jgi:hypothetical protein